MNIFYLDPDPIISASMHCDQHLSKMILESAQMLSTIVNIPEVYKPTHPSHPCVLWLRESPHNVSYLCALARELDNIRQTVRNVDEHASIHVLNICEWKLLGDFHSYAPEKAVPIFCGPPMFKPPYFHGSVPLQYQEYYKYKAKHWALDIKVRMSYRGRSVPAFLKDSPYVSV